METLNYSPRGQLQIEKQEKHNVSMARRKLNQHRGGNSRWGILSKKTAEESEDCLRCKFFLQFSSNLLPVFLWRLEEWVLRQRSRPFEWFSSLVRLLPVRFYAAIFHHDATLFAIYFFPELPVHILTSTHESLVLFALLEMCYTLRGMLSYPE